MTTTNAPEGQRPAPLAWSKVTDIHAPFEGDDGFMLFPGPVVPTGELLDFAKSLRKDAIWAHSQGAARHGGDDADWSVQHQDRNYRAHLLVTVTGKIIVLRAIAKRVPRFSELGYHPELANLLVSSDFAPAGGLIFISGSSGNGKSTTAASLLVERVRTHGLFALTVEDPTEFALHNTYPSQIGRSGMIVQVPAARDMLARELRGALRCYPSNLRGSMLMVGEIRDAAEAADVLRASMNGLLVITTIHASDVISTIERFHAYASKELGAEMAQSLLASSIRAVLTQTLSRGRLTVKSLIAPSSMAPAATLIGNGSFKQLSTEISRQEAALKNGSYAELLRELAVGRPVR